MVDMGGNFYGYMGDMSRVFSIGKLPEKAYVAHQVCLDIQEAVVEKAKPGAVCEDLYNLAIDIVTKAGFADNFMGATQKAKFIGHGIGLEINEPLSSTVDKNGTLELLTKYFQRGIHSQLDLFTEINLSTFDSLFQSHTRYAGNHLPAPPYRNTEAARQGHDHCTKSELSARLHSKQESRFFLLQL